MNILTFDLEDWFHILEHRSTNSVEDWEILEGRFAEGIDRILGLLQKHHHKATFFCMGWIARRYPHVIRNIASYGYEVGCHSNMHQLVHTLTPVTFRQSLKDAIASIVDITSTPVRSYRAPGFSITRETLWAWEILADCGIANDCSVFPAYRSHGGYPGFPVQGPCRIETPAGEIREFPVNVVPFATRKMVFSGGGYFRLLPYSMIRRLTEGEDYVMTYFHPRDFDFLQPRIRDLSPLRTFRSYVGLRTSAKKLDKWLGEFPFTDLSGATAKIDWDSVPLLHPDLARKKLIVSRPVAVAASDDTMQLMGFRIDTELDTGFTAHGSQFTSKSQQPKANSQQVLINCMNPHSYVLSKKDPLFREALTGSDMLIPDGSGIVLAARILKFKKIRKIAGADLHEYLLKKLNEFHGSCFYLGANPATLDLIRARLAREYPNVRAGFYSPPFKPEFSEEDSEAMIEAVNSYIAKTQNNHLVKMQNRENPDSPAHQFTSSPVLFIGMTAPKQEKWSYRYRDRLEVGMICNIGAVFDFYAGTVKRSSPFWIRIGLEWLPRFLKEPKRLYKRVFVSGPLFLWDVFRYRIGIK